VTCTFNLYIKFVVFAITNYEDAPKVIGNITIRQSAYDFLFEFNRNYEATSYGFRDIIAYIPKIKEVT